MDTKTIVDIKKLEDELAAARERAKVCFLSSANDSIMSLKSIGFEYELVEKNGKPKIGRPRKESQNGTVQKA